MTTPKSPPKDIDEYIAGFPKEVQEILEKVRATMRDAAPNAQETIKYGMPTVTLEGRSAYFAGWKKHIAFYPAPWGVEEFDAELSAYEGAKGTVKFPFDKPIPYDLIGRLTAFTIKNHLESAPAKK